MDVERREGRYHSDIHHTGVTAWFRFMVINEDTDSNSFDTITFQKCVDLPPRAELGNQLGAKIP